MFKQKNAKEKLQTTLGLRYAIELYASLPGADCCVLDMARPIGSSQEPASNLLIRRCVISSFCDIYKEFNTASARLGRRVWRWVLVYGLALFDS